MEKSDPPPSPVSAFGEAPNVHRNDSFDMNCTWRSLPAPPSILT